MPDPVPAGVANTGVEDQTPTATKGFGAREDADETRQAQHTESNDTPTDVNMNAVVARSQAHTVDMAGKSFTANMDRRDKIADIIMAKWGGEKT